MAVHCLAVQLLSSEEKRTDISLQTVSQITYVWAPLEVSRQISQRNTESGKHHQWDGWHRSAECSVLNDKKKVMKIIPTTSSWKIRCSVLQLIIFHPLPSAKKNPSDTIRVVRTEKNYLHHSADRTKFHDDKMESGRTQPRTKWLQQQLETFRTQQIVIENHNWNWNDNDLLWLRRERGKRCLRGTVKFASEDSNIFPRINFAFSVVMLIFCNSIVSQKKIEFFPSLPTRRVSSRKILLFMRGYVNFDVNKTRWDLIDVDFRNFSRNRVRGWHSNWK